MKGQTAHCQYCGTPFIKRRADHRFCKTSHRVTYHQKKKQPKASKRFDTAGGQQVTIAHRAAAPPPPRKQDFANSPMFVKSVKENYTSVSGVGRERTVLLAQKQYWEGIYNDTFKGRLNGLALFGAGAGYLLAQSEEDRCKKSKKCDSSPDKLLSALIGAGLGLAVESLAPDPETIRAEAKRNLQSIDANLARLKLVQSNVQYFAQKNSIPLKAPRTSITSGKDYRNAKIPTIGLGGRWKYLMGDPSPGFFALLSGNSGNGKTTLAVKFAQHLEENHGKVLFATYEQKGKNVPFQKLMIRERASFDVSEYPPATIKELGAIASRYQFLVIDSINYAGFQPEDIEQLREKYPNLSVIGIMQNTKEGKFKGSNEFLHNADVWITAEKGKAYQLKSRFVESRSDLAIWEESV